MYDKTLISDALENYVKTVIRIGEVLDVDGLDMFVFLLPESIW